MHILMTLHRTLRADGLLDGPLQGEMVVLPLDDPDPPGLAPFAAPATGFVGLDSHDVIPTAEVVGLDVSPHVVMGHVTASFERLRAGADDEVLAAAAQVTAEMLELAEQFPVGTVLQRRGDHVRAHIPIAARGADPSAPGTGAGAALAGG